MKKTVVGFVAIAVFAMTVVGLQGVVAGPVQTLSACIKVVQGEPLGTATYSWWDDGKARLDIAVDSLVPGDYCIVVDQVKLDAILTVDDSGAGSLRLDTRWGDVIPVIVVGSNIALKNCADETIVYCGSFK